MDQIKLFYLGETDEDEIRDLQKDVNKWLAKKDESIEVKSITTAMANDEAEIIITVHYKAKPLSL